MRLLTYNIWDGGGERAALIAEVIASANPDIVLLNEADDERVVAQLAKRLAYDHVWARGSGDKHIALLTRLPIVAWRVYNRPPITQAMLYTKLQIPTTHPPNHPNTQPPNHPTIQLFGVHLMPYFMLLPYEFARWRTVRALLQLVAREAHEPHIICGDFNAATAGERADTNVFSRNIQRQLWLQANRQPRFALSPITRAGYTDCFRRAHPTAAGLTWMPWALSARLDYIFADTQMASRLQSCAVITTPPAEQASDHFPLVADFS